MPPIPGIEMSHNNSSGQNSSVQATAANPVYAARQSNPRFLKMMQRVSATACSSSTTKILRFILPEFLGRVQPSPNPYPAPIPLDPRSEAQQDRLPGREAQQPAIRSSGEDCYVAYCRKYCAIGIAAKVVSLHVHFCDLEHIFILGVENRLCIQLGHSSDFPKFLRTQPTRD